MLFSCLPWCCLKCAATKTRRAWSLVEGWSGACTVVIVCWFIYVCNEDHFLHTVHGHFTSGIILQVLEENVLNRQFKSRNEYETKFWHDEKKNTRAFDLTEYLLVLRGISRGKNPKLTASRTESEGQMNFGRTMCKLIKNSRGWYKIQPKNDTKNK